MSASREALMQEFTDSAELDRRVLETVAKILAKSPRAVLIAWEDDVSFGVTAVPFSRSLVKGLVDTAFDAVFGDEVAANEDDD
jgi:hypothetical protein